MRQLIALAKEHSIDYRIAGDRLLLAEDFTIDGKPGRQWIDATRWTARKMLRWLGY